MAKLWFVRRVITMEKTTELRTNVGTVVVVGILLLAFIGAAIFLYVKNQPEAGRLVIDIAVAFFGWATGRAVGERAGLAARQ